MTHLPALSLLCCSVGENSLLVTSIAVNMGLESATGCITTEQLESMENALAQQWETCSTIPHPLDEL